MGQGFKHPRILNLSGQIDVGRQTGLSSQYEHVPVCLHVCTILLMFQLADKFRETWYEHRGSFPLVSYLHSCRSQMTRGLMHELSSFSRTLRLWVRIPQKPRMSVCVFSVFMLFCVGSGLTTG
jgi:hypothetical protein